MRATISNPATSRRTVLATAAALGAAVALPSPSPRAPRTRPPGMPRRCAAAGTRCSPAVPDST
nr:twin-arginine translocation signal domain-containing protein [Streptomyces finlayi]